MYTPVAVLRGINAGEAGEPDAGEVPGAACSAAYEAAFGKLTLPAAQGERAACAGTPALATPVVYLCLPRGYGRIRLGNACFERTLAAATTGNWRTGRALVELRSRAG